MTTVFLKGLKIVQSHKQPILNEWERILIHLKNAGKKSEKNAEETIHFFSKHLFDLNSDEDEVIATIENTWEQKLPELLQTNQFIVTLLENAVHKVIQSNANHLHQDHQAVQYLFSILGEHILTQPYHKHFALDTFLKQLVSSKQLPIEWAAILIKQEDKFIVEKWFNSMSQDLLLGNDELKSDTIYALSELLLGQMVETEDKRRTVLPIPYENGTLLICTNQEDAPQVVPFITYALQIFLLGKETLKMKQHEQQWKDAVIMFNETIIRSQTFDEAVENITEGFVNYLPFERCALFSYSINDQMGFGLFGHRLDNQAIQNITEDIGNLPIIQNSLQILQLFGKNMNYLQPVYVEDAAMGFPEQYIKQFQLQSLVIAPIFTSSTNKLLGAAILDQGPNTKFKVTQETFTALIKFGQSAGEILKKYHTDRTEQQIDRIHLSPREVEVLKLMAEGASTNEAAGDLNLSEYTVRDYVSAIMQKMEARNRTEAVARAIRDGTI